MAQFVLTIAESPAADSSSAPAFSGRFEWGGTWRCEVHGDQPAPPAATARERGGLRITIGWPFRSGGDALSENDAWLAAGGDPTILRCLSGRYAFLEIDEREARIVTDIIGSIPVFYWTGPGRCLLTTDLRLIPRSLLKIDPVSTLPLLFFSHNVGHALPWESWRVTGPASIHRVGVGCELIQAPWWRPPPVGSSDREAESRFAPTMERLLGDMDFLLSRGPALSLTGGVDSRTLLALSQLAKTKPRLAVTHGHSQSGDQRVARRLARKLEIQHLSIASEASVGHRFAQLLPELCELTNGGTSALWVHGLEMARRTREITQGVVTGVAGEVARGFYYQGARLDDISAAPEHLVLRKQSGVHIRTILGDILGLSVGAIDDIVATKLHQAVRDRDLAERDWLDGFFLFERTAHMFAASVCLSDRLGLVTVAPFAAPFVADLAFRMPPRMRRAAAFHRHVQRRACPDLVRIPTDTGRPQFVSGPIGRLTGRALGKVRRTLDGRRGNRPCGYETWLFTDENRPALERLRAATKEVGLGTSGVEDLVRAARAGQRSALAAVGNLLGSVVWLASRPDRVPVRP